uniref:Uncharacterized protein n=1 Tax=Oryza sativa subsp. japonica TaxID=39947 RepID=Q94HZ2_ORYSJ|nr:hypothetical protein [Oryza sativa Japonica Group]
MRAAFACGCVAGDGAPRPIDRSNEPTRRVRVSPRTQHMKLVDRSSRRFVSRHASLDRQLAARGKGETKSRCNLPPDMHALHAYPVKTQRGSTASLFQVWTTWFITSTNLGARCARRRMKGVVWVCGWSEGKLQKPAGALRCGRRWTWYVMLLATVVHA